MSVKQLQGVGGRLEGVGKQRRAGNRASYTYALQDFNGGHILTLSLSTLEAYLASVAMWGQRGAVVTGATAASSDFIQPDSSPRHICLQHRAALSGEKRNMLCSPFKQMPLMSPTTHSSLCEWVCTGPAKH